MDTPRDRYQRDPLFARLVDMLAFHLERCDFTPTEVREAAMLAAVIVETRKPGGPWVITRDEADRFDPLAGTALPILEKTLGFNEGDVAGFAWGFDGNERPWPGAEAAYALGREFRRELLGTGDAP